MVWFLIAMLAYFLNAVAATIDKFLLNTAIKDPRVYVYFISLLGGFGAVLAPLGLGIMSVGAYGLAFLIAAFSIAALWTFFIALHRAEASRVVPIVGGLQPIIIFALANYFLNEQLGAQQLIALGLFIIGGFLITYEDGRKVQKKKQWVWYAIMSAVLFGGLHFTSKALFEQVDFINGFVWPRIFTAVGALLFLLSASLRKNLRKQKKSAQPKNLGLFLVGQSAGASFFILINYAISLGSVTIINAMQGIQYVFVLLFTSLITVLRPDILKERLTRRIIIQKVVAIICIVAAIIFMIR